MKKPIQTLKTVLLMAVLSIVTTVSGKAVEWRLATVNP